MHVDHLIDAFHTLVDARSYLYCRNLKIAGSQLLLPRDPYL